MRLFTIALLLATAVCCAIPCVATDSPGAVPTSPEPQPGILIYTEHLMPRLEKAGAYPGPIAVVWESGRMIWSNDPIQGGSPYLEGRFDPGRIRALRAKLDRQKAFGDKYLQRAFFGPDSGYTVIDVRFGDQRLKMMSWHELAEAGGKVAAGEGGLGPIGDRTLEEILAEQPAEYKRFRAVWADVRKAVDSWKPKSAKPFDGRIRVQWDGKVFIE